MSEKKETNGATGGPLRVLAEDEITPANRAVIEWAFAVGVDRACALLAAAIADAKRGDGPPLSVAGVVRLRDELLARPLVFVTREPAPEAEPQTKQPNHPKARKGAKHA